MASVGFLIGTFGEDFGQALGRVKDKLNTNPSCTKSENRDFRRHAPRNPPDANSLSTREYRGVPAGWVVGSGRSSDVLRRRDANVPLRLRREEGRDELEARNRVALGGGANLRVLVAVDIKLEDDTDLAAQACIECAVGGGRGEALCEAVDKETEHRVRQERVVLGADSL